MFFSSYTKKSITIVCLSLMFYTLSMFQCSFYNSVKNAEAVVPVVLAKEAVMVTGALLVAGGAKFATDEGVRAAATEFYNDAPGYIRDKIDQAVLAGKATMIITGEILNTVFDWNRTKAQEAIDNPLAVFKAIQEARTVNFGNRAGTGTTYWFPADATSSTDVRISSGATLLFSNMWFEYGGQISLTLNRTSGANTSLTMQYKNTDTTSNPWKRGLLVQSNSVEIMRFTDNINSGMNIMLMHEGSLLRITVSDQEYTLTDVVGINGSITGYYADGRFDVLTAGVPVNIADNFGLNPYYEKPVVAPNEQISVSVPNGATEYSQLTNITNNYTSVFAQNMVLNPTIDSENRSISLDWELVPGAEQYKVYKDGVLIKEGQLLQNVVVTGIDMRSAFGITVRAYDADGVSVGQGSWAYNPADAGFGDAGIITSIQEMINSLAMSIGLDFPFANVKTGEPAPEAPKEEAYNIFDLLWLFLRFLMACIAFAAKFAIFIVTLTQVPASPDHLPANIAAGLTWFKGLSFYNLNAFGALVLAVQVIIGIRIFKMIRKHIRL